MSLLTPEELQSTYGGTGTLDESIVQLSIDLAEYDISEHLVSNVQQVTGTFEAPWPTDTSELQLPNNFVTELVTVTAKHSLDADCVWIQDVECGVILESKHGIVLISSCNISLGACNCSNVSSPDRAVVEYVYGLLPENTAPTTSLGKSLRMAIAMRSRVWQNALVAGADWGGEYVIESWSSMDYSERRKFASSIVSNPLGAGPFSDAVWRILKTIKGKRMIALTGSKRLGSRSRRGRY